MTLAERRHSRIPMVFSTRYCSILCAKDSRDLDGFFKWPLATAGHKHLRQRAKHKCLGVTLGAADRQRGAGTEVLSPSIKYEPWQGQPNANASMPANTLCNACSGETVAQNIGSRVASSARLTSTSMSTRRFGASSRSAGAPSLPMCAEPVQVLLQRRVRDQVNVSPSSRQSGNVGRCPITNAPAMALPSGKRYRRTVRGS